jgi:hypothetical protein
MTDTSTVDPFRVSAVFDDGGIYTGTMQNMPDARNRYDLFCGHSDRRPAFAGLFGRAEDGLMHLIRYYSGGEEVVLDERTS